MAEKDNTEMAPVMGLIAFTRMTAYARMARDVSQTTIFSDQLALARMGGDYVAAIDALEAQANQAGLSLAEHTQPYVGFFDELEARTRPGDWWERIIKSYVLVGMLADLESTLGAQLGDNFDELAGVAGAIGHDKWVLERIGAAIEDEPTLLARLSMWGRRVGGEVLAAIQKVLANNPNLLPAGVNNQDIIQSITRGHANRMGQLGLAA